MKKRLLSLLLTLAFVTTFVPVTANAVSHGSNGIYGNGTGEVYIDIYSYEFTQLSEASTMGQYAYGQSGCEWFAAARQWQITGNDPDTIWSGSEWWNDGNGRMGYETGKTIAAKALACYSDHVSVVEAVDGDRALVSEGGANRPDNDYCALSYFSISQIESGDTDAGSFLGYVYLGDSAPSVQVSWEGPIIESITATNAVATGKVNFSDNVSTIAVGIRIYDSNGALVAYKDEDIDCSSSYVTFSYDINEDVGYTLVSGKTYKVCFYAVSNGEEYRSPEADFTTEHTHIYTDHVITDPTCTTWGYTTHTCDDCGYSYKDSYTDALGHDYKNGACTRCGMEDPDYRPAPNAPVIKITTSAGKPKIYWDAVDEAVEYWVYRSTDGSSFAYYDSTTKNSYTNTLATIGTTYYYCVKAVNANGAASDYSGTSNIQCKPAAPSVSIYRTNGKPQLKWNAVTGAVKYWIYRSTDGENFNYYDSTTKTSYTNSAAASVTKYYYRVNAVAVVNGKNIMSADSGTKSLMTTLEKPTVSITTSNGKPQLTWKAVADADKYWVYRSTDGEKFEVYITTTKTDYTNTSTNIGVTYYYKVKAVKVVGGENIASDHSAVKDIKCRPAAVALSIDRSNGKPKLKWNAVPDANKYWVYRSLDGKNFDVYVTTTKTNYTNSSTNIGTTYYYKVKAVKTISGKDCASAYSATKSVQCGPAAPNMSVSRVNGKPRLTWNAVSDANKYWVYRSTDGKNFSVYATTTKPRYLNDGAASGTKYYYKVKAVKVVNGKNIASAESNCVSLMTTLANPNVSITTSNGKPHISWDAVDGATGYYVFRSTDGKNYSPLGYTTGTKYTNTDSDAGKTYYYKVKADNSDTDAVTDTTSSKTAERLVEQAKAWLGCKESDGSNEEIIDIYNAHKPLARGYKLGYKDPWCAAFVSACAIKTGMTDIIPTECGCGSMVRLFRKLGEWDESDSRIPNAGDIIFFDWDDSGYGDNEGFPGHVGIVEKVSGSTITVIDGNNKNDAVERRTIQINGRYIRGYGVPKYSGSSPSDIRSPYSNAVSVRCKLAAPTLSITTSEGKPKVTWNAVDGADKYYLYRSTDGKNFEHWDTTKSTTYTNLSTTKDTKYYYKVKAVCGSNSNANSAQSSAVSIKATK